MNHIQLILPGRGATLNRPHRIALAGHLAAARRLALTVLTLAVVAVLVVTLRYLIFEHFHGDDHVVHVLLDAIGAR
jgi:hypothetical protein